MVKKQHTTYFAYLALRQIRLTKLTDCTAEQFNSLVTDGIEQNHRITQVERNLERSSGSNLS